jgi:hypothetical protein
MGVNRPIGRPSDPTAANLYDGFPRSNKIESSQAPQFKAITMATVSEMRQNRGDSVGNLGPRACILAGTDEVLDGGQAVYVWDQTSTAADDGVNVIQAAATKVGRWRLGASLVPVGALLRVTKLSSGSGTITPLATTKAVRVRLWGGGGGGGGVAATAGGVNIGGGGGAGTPAEWVTLTIPASFTYAVGAGGTGGSTAGGQGADGGASTFSDGTTTVTAPGGGGAPGDAAGGALPHLNNGGNGGAVATNGTVNGTGEPGGNAVFLAAGQAYSGAGGSTSYGAGGYSQFAAGAAGIAGSAPGGGGGGAVDRSTNTARAGGAGGAGMILVEEFG